MNPSGAFNFLINAVFDFYAMIILARLLMQLVRADFYNPVAQFVVKATNPLLVPLRRIIPAIGKIDTASVLLIFIVLTLKFMLFSLVSLGGFFPLAIMLQLVVFGFISLVLSFFFYAIFLAVILSWVADAYHPVYQMINQITSPIMNPIRKIIPDMGGLDLSPMVALLLLGALMRLFGA